MDAVQMATDAGTMVRDVGMAMIAALVPLAVALLLARVALRWAVRTVDGNYRDEHWSKGEMFDDERGDYVGRDEGGYYVRDLGSTHRRYDKT